MGDGGVQWMRGESGGARVRVGEKGEGRGKEWVLGNGRKVIHITLGSMMFGHLFATCLGRSL